MVVGERVGVRPSFGGLIIGRTGTIVRIDGRGRCAVRLKGIISERFFIAWFNPIDLDTL